MEASSTMKRETLQVRGATLYYEVRGSGPVLLMMPGGPADATTFRRIENILASKYTVVTYDPRGLSRSTLQEPIEDDRMVEIFADDVHRLLAHFGEAKAQIFASSGGAVIVLELAVRHPEQLDVVVVHEPPSPDLLEDPDGATAAMQEIGDTYASSGLWPAMEKFMRLIKVEGGPPPAPEGELSPEAQEQMAMMQKNIEYFAGHYIPNIGRFRPDFDALQACSCTIVPAVGAESGGQLAHEGGLGLARILGTEAVVFPGDHSGWDGHPEEFARRLTEVLEGGSR